MINLIYILTTTPFQSYCLFFFNDTATTEIYTLSLHDALPISLEDRAHGLQDSVMLGRHDEEVPCPGHHRPAHRLGIVAPAVGNDRRLGQQVEQRLHGLEGAFRWL